MASHMFAAAPSGAQRHLLLLDDRQWDIACWYLGFESSPCTLESPKPSFAASAISAGKMPKISMEDQSIASINSRTPDILRSTSGPSHPDNLTTITVLPMRR